MHRIAESPSPAYLGERKRPDKDRRSFEVFLHSVNGRVYCRKQLVPVQGQKCPAIADVPPVIAMGEASRSVEEVQAWIDRMRAGDPAARDELIGQACERLRRLTRKMLKGFARVKRWELTDDVLQNALLRLWGALREVQPRSAREFYALAALQIRRELIDLARKYYGPEGIGANQASNPGPDSSANMAAVDRADSTQEPSRLAVWTELHQRVDRLPEPEREVFDLLWYQELTQVEAAKVLGVSDDTVRRRWRAARLRIGEMLGGELPGA